MRDFTGKRLLILGGSRISCQIVKKAQEMGIYVLVTDWYPLEKSPAKQMADEALYVSTADVDAVVELIKEKNIDGVVTGFTDSVLPFYPQICEQAGLPSYGSKEAFDIMINKRLYKQLCVDYGVPTVEEYLLTPDFKEEDFAKIKYPVLVKPSDSSGARGVTICHDRKTLEEAYHRAVSFSEKKEVLVERYIVGREVTIFWLFRDGKYYLSGHSNRHVKHNQEGVIPLPVGYTWPSIYLKKYREEVEPKAKEMFKSVGIENGMMFMQCLVEDGNCIVYDIGYRLTGSLEYILQDKLFGYNPLTMMIEFALTGSIRDRDLDEIVTPEYDTYAANITFLVRPGKIGRIEGYDELLAIPGMIDAVKAHVEGSVIPPEAKGTLRQIVLRAFASSDTIDGLADIFNKAHAVFKVYDEDGESMLLDVFDTDEMYEVLV